MSRLLIKSLSYIFAPVYQQFIQDLKHPQIAQQQVKAKIIQKLKKTQYGANLKISNGQDWQSLPIIEYETLEPWIAKQREYPLKPILTPEKIHFWECTSGSTGVKKMIPYTTSLLASFSNMFCIWAYDLIRYGPSFSTGKTYLCISPDIGQNQGGTDDSDYINPYLRWLLSRFLVRVKGNFSTVEAFRWTLACALLETPDLEVFSLWSPSFLTTQLKFMETNAKELQNLLKNRLSSKRWQLLAQPQIPWSELWPNLKLISCWDRQYAADCATTLKQYFPKVFLQGKGLLATEAPMTIPLIPAQGFVPLVNQVVLEFLNPKGEVLNLTQLEKGVTYELIISQLGGLSRYCMHDRVEVSHWYFETPCLNFVGRGEQVSDLVGEKLNIQFVTDCLKRLGYTKLGFCCLVPVQGETPYYCLLLEKAIETTAAISQQLEAYLQDCYHYQRARQLEQLGSLQVMIHPQIAQWFQGTKRLGDGKYSILATPMKQEQLNSFYSYSFTNVN